MQSRYAIIAAVLVVFLAAQVFGLFGPKAGPGASLSSDGLNIREMMIVENPA